MGPQTSPIEDKTRIAGVLSAILPYAVSSPLRVVSPSAVTRSELAFRLIESFGEYQSCKASCLRPA